MELKWKTMAQEPLKEDDENSYLVIIKTDEEPSYIAWVYSDTQMQSDDAIFPMDFVRYYAKIPTTEEVEKEIEEKEN